MSELRRPLISLDIGGTLGAAKGPGLAARLAELSPLDPGEARCRMREVLHTAPVLTDAVIDKVSAALGIPSAAFPTGLCAPPLVLYPGVDQALRLLSEHATVVTLSNVACAEADPERLQELLSPWVSAQFPSCRTGYAKPDPRAFGAVTAAHGVRSTDLTHVGDDWECDIRGAIATGASALWISRGRTPPDEDFIVKHGVVVADDFTDAVQHLLRPHDLRSP